MRIYEIHCDDLLVFVMKWNCRMSLCVDSELGRLWCVQEILASWTDKRSEGADASKTLAFFDPHST